MKRVLILLILNFPLSILHSSPAQSAALERLRVGYPSPSANFYPLFATKEANLFEKYGFEAEMIYVQGVQLIAGPSGRSVGFLDRSPVWCFSKHRSKDRTSFSSPAPTTVSR